MTYRQWSHNFVRHFCSILAVVVIFPALALMADDASAQQPHWIWSPTNTGPGDVADNEVYFRKKFTLIRPDLSEMTLAASDRYQLFVNGQLASEGESYGTPVEIDVNSLLLPGVNLISARVMQVDSQNAGLAVKFRVKEKGESRWRSLVSDSTWKTRTREIEGWSTTSCNDLSWLPADQLKVATVVEQNRIQPETQRVPANTVSAKSRVSSADGRFQVGAQFEVQQVMLDSETGPVIAMEFNEFGKMILSKEGGPLMIADPSVSLKQPGRIRVLCSEVNTCQGILPLNGDIFVTGSGPQGLGLYRLSDRNNDGTMEVIATLIKFTGQPGEHGPHGITLGPDGMIYVSVGNGSQVIGDVNRTSPTGNSYEGDLIPRIEDPGGHAEGVKAPGGTIVRCTVDGTRIERVASGLRNCYDIVFDSFGELFTHDSDMESDMGMTWYRPTMIFHVAAGSEFGWRSGWSKFPTYFMDQTPPVCETGRGSPTGAVCYRHLQFPARYHDTMFFADWSEGRIMTMQKSADGATWSGKTEEFLKGKPLNVCDLAVGEDGALYFCTGGRGTSGGVYRVIWKGNVPESMMDFDSDLARVIKHPQPDSAWARQNIARLKGRMGIEEWNKAIAGTALEKRNPQRLRLRALERMVLYGPVPTAEFLQTLSEDEDYVIRARAAFLCGLKDRNQNAGILGKLVTDTAPMVRVQACRSMLRLGQVPAFETLVPMLSSVDRVECMTARRLLERMPVDGWSESVFSTEDTRLFLAGSMAMMTAEPTLERAYRVLATCSEKMDGFISDADFIDMLRVMQLALSRGNVDPARIPAFGERIVAEFPSGNGIINRELSRLMAFLGTGQLDGERISSYFASEADSEIDKLHVAMHLQHIGSNLAPIERLAVIDYLEQSAAKSGGGSYKHYIKTALGSVGATLTADQVKDVLRNGAQWPNSLVSAFYQLPQELDQESVALIIEADRGLAVVDNEDAVQARLGVIAVLAQSRNPVAMEHLRLLWREEPDRRGDISIGLAQEPAGENWAYLISSLPVLDDMTSSEVVDKLISVNRRPRDPEHYRQLIQLGYRLRNDGAKKAASLLEHWTGKSTGPTTEDWTVVMNRWKGWFEEEWPDQPGLTFESTPAAGRYTMTDVLNHLENTRDANPVNGRNVFAKAQCGACHRCGAEGTPSGPDLTAIASRFTNREILEAIIHPSKVVPDQYRARTILTEDGRTVTGMAIKDNDGSWMITQADGERIRLTRDEIEAVKETDVSSMPDRLLDNLTASEIADLFAFLQGGAGQQAQQPTGQTVR